MSEPLDTRTYVRGVALIIASIFATGGMVVSALPYKGVAWIFILLIGTAVLFLMVESAVESDGISRRFFNLWPGVDIHD